MSRHATRAPSGSDRTSLYEKSPERRSAISDHITIVLDRLLIDIGGDCLFP